MIFRYSTPWDQWKAKTPVILVALRADNELHHEAIKEFYKQNWFRLKQQNFSAAKFMSKNTVWGIRKLYISYVRLY